MDQIISKRDFDKEAAAWDTPVRIKLAKDMASAVMDKISLRPEMDVLDFGSGTGLVSLALRPKVNSLTCVDSSPGMLDVLMQKVSRGAVPGVKILCCDLDSGEPLSGSFHLIVTTMTLHHIKDVRSLLGKFFEVLLPGGALAVVDLDLEGGLFHSDHRGVFHHGFDRQVLRRIFLDSGFKDVQDSLVTEVEKPLVNGEMRKFSIFLMTGRRIE